MVSNFNREERLVREGEGMGGKRVAEFMMWEMEGRTDSRKRTWVAPESARMGEGVMEHKKVGGEESSSESSGSYSTKGLMGQKRETGVVVTMVGIRENVV